MKKAAVIFLAVSIMITAIPYVATANGEIEDVAVSDGLSVLRSLEVSADEGGASLEISIRDGFEAEQTVTFLTEAISLDEYDGIRLWAKNGNGNSIGFYWSFNSASENALLTKAAYYTVDKNGKHSEKLLSSAGMATIPANFEGWIYIPFSSIKVLPEFISEMHIYISPADMGGNKFYIDEIGGYNGNLPLYDFEDMTGLSSGAGFDRTIVDDGPGQDNVLKLVCNSSSAAAVGFLNLDMRSAKTSDRNVDGIEGIRFWIKTESGDKNSQNTDKNIYLYTAYNFPSHSHYPDWCTYKMPYYLVYSDGEVVSKQRVLKKEYERYQKGIVIPDGFEGWVYMPFNTDALWNGSSSKWVSQTNGLLSMLKISAANAVGKTVYLDSLGFYTDKSVPEGEISAISFFSMCTAEMDAERAENVAALIDSLLPYSLDMGEDIAKAKAAYDALTLKQRQLVDNYSVLSDAQTLLCKAEKSAVQLDFEAPDGLNDIEIKNPEKVTAALDSSVFCTGASSLAIGTEDGTGGVNTVNLKVNDSLDSLFSFEFWIKTGEKKAEITFQVDMPDRCTIKTGSRYYLSGANKSESFSVQEKKIGEYYQPYMTVPANFEGYVNIPFASLKCYSSSAIEPDKTGVVYLGIIGGNSLNIDTVRGSFMLAQSSMTDEEICAVWESVSDLRNRIESLTDITLEDAGRVQDIRKQFNDMSVNLQLLIDNTEILENAEAKLRELKPSKYLLDYEDKTLYDWTGLSTDICQTEFEYDDPLEGNVSLKITSSDSGEFMSVAFKKPLVDLTEYNGVEMRVKTADKPAVFFIQADIPVRALLQAGAPYYLTDMSGNITGYTSTGTNLGGKYGWCPLVTIPANFDGFFSFKCESFKCYDSAAQTDLTKMGNFYFVFTQSTELSVDAVRVYKRVLEGLNMLDDERTEAQKAEDFDSDVIALGVITKAKQTEIAALRKRYTAFSDECKALVTSLKQLEAAEKKITALLSSDVLFDFDDKEILWSCSEGAEATAGTEKALSGNALKLTYPKASYFNFSNVRRGFSGKTGIEFYADSEACSLISLQADAPYRCYIPKNTVYYLIDSEGKVTEKETFLNGYISIPAGFVGKVQVPFKSFAAYDANTDFQCEQLGDLYFSFAEGYGKYGKLYIDSVKIY